MRPHGADLSCCCDCSTITFDEITSQIHNSLRLIFLTNGIILLFVGREGRIESAGNGIGSGMTGVLVRPVPREGPHVRCPRHSVTANVRAMVTPSDYHPQIHNDTG